MVEQEQACDGQIVVGPVMAPEGYHKDRSLALADSLSEEQAGDLLHLLDCPACQGLVRQTGLKDLVGRSVGHPAYDRLWQDLEVRMPGLVKEMEERTAEAQGLMDRLLGSPAAERHALAGTAEFRNLKLADLLLLESGGLQP